MLTCCLGTDRAERRVATHNSSIDISAVYRSQKSPSLKIETHVVDALPKQVGRGADKSAARSERNDDSSDCALAKVSTITSVAVDQRQRACVAC